MTNAVNIAQSGSNNQTMRNRIINGAMVIDQRNNGASVAFGDVFVTDRWNCYETGSMAFTGQRSTTAPAGFTNSLLITTTTAASPTASSRSQLGQVIEGYNIADLGWGTANAQPVTLSFWVRSSLTGQFGGAVANYTTTRSYPFIYTISAANTWEYKTITIPGDTTGTWNTDNSGGITLTFDLGMGSDLLGTAGSWAGVNYRGAIGDVKLSETNGATFYITGVQLEEGTAASPFENRLYGTELALCQRYYEKFDAGGVSGPYAAFGMGYSNGTNGPILFKFAVNKRANPTISQGGTIRVLSGPATGSSWSANDNYLGTSGGYSNSTWTTSITSGLPVMVTASNDTAAFVAFSAEL